MAERLRADGLKVWFDEWVIKPGDSIPSKIEEGLEHSRVLVLCMSANAFGSDWAQLEAGTFRFRDPLNKERRFIPLRLDDAPIKGSLAHFHYVNWLPADREQEYSKLLESCRPVKTAITPQREAIRRGLEGKIISLGHTGAIRGVAFSPDGKLALPAPMTVQCGSGTWKPEAACACWKATPRRHKCGLVPQWSPCGLRREGQYGAALGRGNRRLLARVGRPLRQRQERGLEHRWPPRSLRRL